MAGPTSFERSTYYTDTPNMNGNRAQANNYTLDGIDMNETYNNLISSGQCGAGGFAGGPGNHGQFALPTTAT